MLSSDETGGVPQYREDCNFGGAQAEKIKSSEKIECDKAEWRNNGAGAPAVCVDQPVQLVLAYELDGRGGVIVCQFV